MVLEAFSNPDEINYCHPILGTALHQASHTGNLDMVAGLIANQANRDLTADPEIFLRIMGNTMNGVIPPGSPLWLALCQLQVESIPEAKREIIFQLKSVNELLLAGELSDEKMKEVVRQLQLWKTQDRKKYEQRGQERSIV